MRASNPTWTRQAHEHERLIYVGMTVAPVRRIREHAYAESTGAVEIELTVRDQIVTRIKVSEGTKRIARTGYMDYGEFALGCLFNAYSSAFSDALSGPVATSTR